MKKLKLLLIFLSILCLLGGVAYAIYGLSVPSHVKIIQSPGNGGSGGNIALAFFQNATCTQPCTFVEWGNIAQSMTQTKTEMLWVKNIGNVPATITGNNSLPVGIGTLLVQFKQGPQWVASLTLNVGQVCETKGVITILASSPLGEANFNIIIEAQ